MEQTGGDMNSASRHKDEKSPKDRYETQSES